MKKKNWMSIAKKNITKYKKYLPIIIRNYFCLEN